MPVVLVGVVVFAMPIVPLFVETLLSYFASSGLEHQLVAVMQSPSFS